VCPKKEAGRLGQVWAGRIPRRPFFQEASHVQVTWGKALSYAG